MVDKIMQPESETGSPGGKKIWLALFIIAATAYLIDFTFYGQRIHDIVGASGFGLMAYGTWKNNKIAANSGAALVFAALASKFLL